MIVRCKSTLPDKNDCPMLLYCLARLSDSTITGCGMPLYEAGLIKKEEILVVHKVKEERKNDRN